MRSFVFGLLLVLCWSTAYARAPKCPVSEADDPIKAESDITEENIIKIGTKLPKGTADLSVTDIVACFPTEFRKSYVMVYDSKSLQTGTTAKPRVVLYGKTGKALVAFNPTENEIEIIQYVKSDPPKIGHEFKPKLVEVQKTGVHSGDTAICASCHAGGNAPFRPKFDAYDRWPGIWGSRSSVGQDTISPTECLQYKAFLAEQAKDRDSPYKVIPLQKSRDVIPEPELAGGCKVKNGATTSPAGQLNHVVSELNINRVKEGLKGDISKPESKLKFDKYRHLWMSAALGCNMVKPDFTPAPDSYFARSLPEGVMEKADCAGIRKEVAAAMVEEFEDQAKQMNATSCKYPISNASVAGAGYAYIMIDNKTCGNDRQKCRAACLHAIEDIKAHKAGAPNKSILKAVEFEGTADFEMISTFCCTAKIVAQQSGDPNLSCKNWSYATRGKKTTSYSMADGLPGIRALADKMAMDPDYTAGLEQYKPDSISMICCKDVESYFTYSGMNDTQKKTASECQTMNPNSETCAGVRRFLHKGESPPRNSGNDFPFLATSCNPPIATGDAAKAKDAITEKDAHLVDYQNRARACRELAFKSQRTLRGFDNGDYTHCAPPSYGPAEKDRRLASALAEQPTACPKIDDKGAQPGLPGPSAPDFFPR